VWKFSINIPPPPASTVPSVPGLPFGNSFISATTGFTTGSVEIFKGNNFGNLVDG
jgi:hypothetical protein